MALLSSLVETSREGARSAARSSKTRLLADYLTPLDDEALEIAFSDLQASSRYPGGLALRLARVKRYRPDKRIEDADTMEMGRRIFAAQSA